MTFREVAKATRLKDQPRFITVAWWLVVLIIPLLAISDAAAERHFTITNNKPGR